jgi:hypothetical protein
MVARVSGRRHGRSTATSMIVPRQTRSAAVSSAPTAGNNCLATEAPSRNETIAPHSDSAASQTGGAYFLVAALCIYVLRPC